MLRLAVHPSARDAVQEVLDGVSGEDRDRAATITLVDTGSEDAVRSDALFLQGLDEPTILDLLERAPGLTWLHSPGAGVEGWPLAEIAERDITLTNAAGVYAIPMAEWVVATLLQIVKRTDEVRQAQRRREWLTGLPAEELTGATLLVLGSGGIARQVIVRAAAFGMHVIVANRRGGEVEHADRVVQGDAWRDLLGEVDFVVSTLPLTADTAGSFGAAEIARLKPTAWFVNVGRGGTVDQGALFSALAAERIGGAALDVFATEPLPADSPAWELANLIVSPHTSGASPVSERRSLDLLVANALRRVAGERLENVVDLSAGY